MKVFLLVLFSAVLVLQLASAFPKFRVHREPQSQLDMDLSEKADMLRTDLFEHILYMLLGILKEHIERHKTLFEIVLKYVHDPESDALKEQLAKFSNLVGQANSLPEEETLETLEKLFNLFGDCTELVNKYDELESPTEEEKLIKRYIDGSGFILEFVADFMQLRLIYKAHIQEYVDLISDDDKVKDGKFLEWFKKFKTTTDFDESVLHQKDGKFFEWLHKFKPNTDFDKSVDGTMEVFEFFRDDDHENKK